MPKLKIKKRAGLFINEYVGIKVRGKGMKAEERLFFISTILSTIMTCHVAITSYHIFE